MDKWLIIVGGILCIAYGIYMAIIRVKSPEKLGKYETMKNKFGDVTGKIIHIVSYTVLPILFGIAMIFKYFV